MWNYGQFQSSWGRSFLNIAWACYLLLFKTNLYHWSEPFSDQEGAKHSPFIIISFNQFSFRVRLQTLFCNFCLTSTSKRGKLKFMHPHHTYLMKIAYSRSQENFKISFSAKEHVGPYLLRAHVAIFPSTPSTEAPGQKKIV